MNTANVSRRRVVCTGTGRRFPEKAARLVWSTLDLMALRAWPDYLNLRENITFHLNGCPANAYGAYRHDRDGHHIYLRPRKRHPQGLAFTIAHELRHAWQYETGRLSTMGGHPWAWDGQEPCDGSENDPSERDADAAARAWIQAAW